MSVSGIVLKKKSQFLASTSRTAICGTMLMAFLVASVLLFAGQMLTQAPQPVQSSGATWIVNLRPLNSGPFASVLLKLAGALARYFGS